jgi:hypothetical protein
MSSFIIEIFGEIEKYFFWLRNLLKLYDYKNNSCEINSKFGLKKWGVLLIKSKNFRIIGMLEYLFKLSLKKNIFLNLFSLKKNSYFLNSFYDPTVQDYNLLLKISLRKDIYIFIKKNKLLSRFNVLSSFLKVKHHSNRLVVQLYNQFQISYFLQSISDEILVSGKIRFFYEKKSFFYKKHLKKISYSRPTQNLILCCKKTERQPNKKTKLFSLIFYKNYSTAIYKNLAETLGNFFYIKSRNKHNIHTIDNEMINLIINTKQINNLIFANAFSMTEFN